MLKVLVGTNRDRGGPGRGALGRLGHVAGYSALLGSLTCVIPNAFLALRLAVPRRDPGANALMRAAYIGELGKLALTVLMFSIVFAAGAATIGGGIVCRLYRGAVDDLRRSADARRTGNGRDDE